MSRKSISFRFPNERGETLAGILDMPRADPLFYALFGPCFTCVKESHAAFKIGRSLAERRVTTLRFDVSGVGESEGVLAKTNFTTRVFDILAAARALESSYAAPKLLIGHSISGTAALTSAKHLPFVKAIATIGSPSDPASVIEKFRIHHQMEENESGVVIDILGRKTFFEKSFIDNMLSQSVPEDIANLTQKLFIFHAPNDSIVSFDNAKTIYNHATGNRELVPLSATATHLLEKGNEDADFIADKLIDWFAKEND